MPDNVNITVNETTENVVINPSISTDVIDVNITSTTENVNIAVTPELTTININSVTSVSPVTSVNGQIGDVVIPTSDNNFTTVLKNKLDGIQAGAEVNVNADWNATSGDAQILNKPNIPSISGLATTTYVDTQDALKVDKNTAITGATKTKITFDSKGLVTSGDDATTADIADSSNKRYQTDNQQSFNDATSSIQTQLNSKGTFTLPSLTSGSVLFSNGTTIAQDNSNLFWDDTNNRLNIGGISSNTARLGIKAGGALSTDIAFKVRNSVDTADLVTINGLGNVGIGVNPTIGLDTRNGFNLYTTGGVHYLTTVSTSSTDATLLFTRTAQNGIYRFKLGGTASGGLELSTDFGSGECKFNAQSGGFFSTFFSNGVERMRIPTTGNVLIGTTTDVASSKLTVDSTTQGFLPPRMTTTQKNAIASPATGLVIFDTTLNKLCVRGATSWETITSI
jgi:hypothetical protein